MGVGGGRGGGKNESWWMDHRVGGLGAGEG